MEVCEPIMTWALNIGQRDALNNQTTMFPKRALDIAKALKNASIPIEKPPIYSFNYVKALYYLGKMSFNLGI